MRAGRPSSPDRGDEVIGAASASLVGLSGVVTAATLAGMRFDSPRGGRMLFDSGPVTFD